MKEQPKHKYSSKNVSNFCRSFHIWPQEAYCLHRTSVLVPCGGGGGGTPILSWQWGGGSWLGVPLVSMHGVPLPSPDLILNQRPRQEPGTGVPPPPEMTWDQRPWKEPGTMVPPPLVNRQTNWKYYLPLILCTRAITNNIQNIIACLLACSLFPNCGPVSCTTWPSDSG